MYRFSFSGYHDTCRIAVHSKALLAVGSMRGCSSNDMTVEFAMKDFVLECKTTSFRLSAHSYVRTTYERSSFITVILSRNCGAPCIIIGLRHQS